MDNISIQRIKEAHPDVRDGLLLDYTNANNKLGPRVRLRLAYVYRSPELQHQLFLQRPKVTNADSWQSIHNYGLAFDIVLLLDKNGDGVFEEATWDMVKDFDGDKIADWMEVTNYFKAQGWTWGGDWKRFPDGPHFQKDFGFTWQQLHQKIKDGQTITDENGIVYPKLK